MMKMMMLSAHMVMLSRKDWQNSPISGPRSMPIRVSSSVSSAEPSTAVDPEINPPAPLITVWQTSNTAIVISKQLVISITATKVLKIHLKKIQVSKLARLLWSIIIWINS